MRKFVVGIEEKSVYSERENVMVTDGVIRFLLSTRITSKYVCLQKKIKKCQGFS